MLSKLHQSFGAGMVFQNWGEGVRTSDPHINQLLDAGCMTLEEAVLFNQGQFLERAVSWGLSAGSTPSSQGNKFFGPDGGPGSCNIGSITACFIWLYLVTLSSIVSVKYQFFTFKFCLQLCPSDLGSETL